MENRDAHGAIGIYIGMEKVASEFHYGWAKRIVFRKGQSGWE
jgi:hypothetical protein